LLQRDRAYSSRGKERALIAAGVGALAAAGTTARRTRHRWPYQPVLEQLHLEDRNTAGRERPLRIGFVTDLHVGPAIRAADVDRAMILLFEAAPDLLLFGGDFVCESPRFIPETAAVLCAYAEAAPLGAVGVLGNHDYSNDAPRLVSHLERAGIQILRNEATAVCTGGATLWIAGIDDAVLSTPDPARAFSGVPSEARSIALWHEPDWAAKVVPYNPLIQLSGHSHGGQLRLPILGHVAAPFGGRRHVAGLNFEGGMPVYTSHGIGVYRPPIRFRCPPEVTLITMSQVGDASRSRGAIHAHAGDR
jgi:predicted MPP superfamily phosphohydrolase